MDFKIIASVCSCLCGISIHNLALTDWTENKLAYLEIAPAGR